LPEGSVIDGSALTADVDEVFDYVVVGSGAAGAVAAHVLAKAGYEVAIVEEGPWVRTHEFGERVIDAFQRMYRDAGTQVVEGRSYMPLIQGRCVGGSTVMNSAIAHRTPEDVLDEWAKRFGLGGAITAAALEPHFAALEQDLNAQAVSEDVLGENSRLFLDEAHAEGLPARRMHRYERGCRGSGRCNTGCPHGAKQGMNVSYVPWALALGARLYCSSRVERVAIREGRAVGVVARGCRADDGTVGTARAGVTGVASEPACLRLSARRGVVVAASAIQTPNLLRRSGLRGRAIGAHFQCHPGFALAGVFDRPVSMSFGATQGAESTHLRRSERIKLETLSMPPELAIARFPGTGTELIRRLGSFPHLALWAVVARAEAEGTVTSGWGGRDKVRLSLTRADVERVRKGTVLLARMMFEAGAREVWPGVHGVPSVLRSPDEVRLLEQARPEARAFGMITTHLFGTARMGGVHRRHAEHRDHREHREHRSTLAAADRDQTVVGANFESHEVSCLYVVDSSVFPTNLGVNPQHSIMAMSRLAATRLIEERRESAAA
jgi:choline dehydrogenase-like flavoprotein